MGLCTSLAKQMLLKIVGESGTSSSNSESVYLGLSSSEVQSDGSGIVEPTAASYSRVLIGTSGYTGEDKASYFTGKETDGSFVEVKNEAGQVTEWYITNLKEIHFNLVKESAGWGDIEYYFLTTSATGTEASAVRFTGKIQVKQSDGSYAVAKINPTQNTVPVIEAGAIRISITTDAYTGE